MTFLWYLPGYSRYIGGRCLGERHAMSDALDKLRLEHDIESDKLRLEHDIKSDDRDYGLKAAEAKDRKRALRLTVEELKLRREEIRKPFWRDTVTMGLVG